MLDANRAAAKPKSRIGFVLDYIPDLRVISKEAILSRDSYTDRWLQSLQKAGAEGTKYVPYPGIKATESHQHRFGHRVKLVPVTHRLLPLAGRLRPWSHRTKMLAFTLNLRKEVVKDRIQVLHYANYFASNFVLSPLGAGGASTVSWWTGGDVPSARIPRWTWYFALRPAFRRAKGIMIGDYPMRKETLAWLLRKDERKIRPFELIRVDQGLFRPIDKKEARQVIGRPKSSIELLCVISLIPLPNNNPNDRHPYLMLRTLKEALADGGRGQEVFVSVVGTGKGLGPLTALAQELGIAENVRFIGRVEHDALPWHYAAADLVFVPYLLEKLNETNVLAEAFSCARPAVAFRRTAKSELSQPGGFLVTARPNEGGHELAGILSDPSGLEAKATEGYLLRGRFSVETAGTDLLAAYYQMVMR